MTDKNDNVKLANELLDKIIQSSEQKLNQLAEERNRSDVSFYDMSLDEDGCPFSYGNADDVYSDGFSNGSLDGQYDLALQIKHLLSI